MEVDGLNLAAENICQRLSLSTDARQNLQIELEMVNGAKILDFGSNRIGTLEAGIQLSRICLADQASISILPDAMSIGAENLDLLQIETDHPLLACIASQYAGWPFSTEHLFSMCSGPARLLRGKEDILKRFDLSTNDRNAVGILETNQIPSARDVQEFAEECQCDPENVTICLARTSSLPGTMQVVARSIETAMHKLYELGFDLTKVKRGIGTAPIPPVAKDDYDAMGWTNDAILYGGEVQLWVDETVPIDEWIHQTPSSSSDQFGRPFKDIFEEYDRDFYKVDRLLFAPAKVTLSCQESGESACAGEIRTDLLKSSFVNGA